MRSLRRGAACLLVLSLASGPAVALSIFDIIQLTESDYADQQIIALIESTDSMFELQAEDLPRLKQLGLSEPVIRAMLERVPAEAPRGVPEEGSAPPGSMNGRVPIGDAAAAPEHAHESSGSDSGAGSPEPHSESRREPGSSGDFIPPRDPSSRGKGSFPGGAAQPLVSFHRVHEERSGDHFHIAVTLSGLEILILRAEGAFPSLQARALEVAQRLDAALALGHGTFYMSSGVRGPSVAFQSAATQQRITVLDVSAADAHAYELRSGRQVSRQLLAAYWADLLSDFGAIAMGRRPSRTLALHDGDALGILYQALRSSEGNGGGLRGAAELLPLSVKHHLESLAAAVPVDYDRGEDWSN